MDSASGEIKRRLGVGGHSFFFSPEGKNLDREKQCLLISVDREVEGVRHVGRCWGEG